MTLKEFRFPSDDPKMKDIVYRDPIPRTYSGYYQAYRQKRKLEGRPVKPSHTPKISKFKRADFVAWDGEGVTDESGIHRYTLLANSRKARLYNPSGIKTREALDFIYSEGLKYRRSIHVIFAGNYDFDMIMGGLPYEKLEELYKSKSCIFECYNIFWIRKKRLSINKIDPHQPDSTVIHKDHVKLKYLGGVTIWDSFGFFQGSFVSALETWLGAENVPELDIIKEMKKRRSEFTDEDNEEVQKYNDLELRYLVKMMSKLNAACQEAGLVVNKWHGAGAVADAWLQKYGIKNYIGPLNGRAQEAAQYAFSGGRIEAILLGHNEKKKVYRYDINSAYPSQMPKLPCLAHGTWYHTYNKPISKFSIVHIAWNLEDGRRFYPFFFRTRKHSIIYPTFGEGWYWYPEYILEPNVQVFESWSYITDCSCDPFKDINRSYDYRLKLRDEGSAAEKAIKLGMNSLYGKFIQKAGYERGGHIPAYNCIAWAGYITAATRAQLYTAAMQAPESIIAFATDAIFTYKKLKLPCSNKLGEWSLDTFNGITIVQAGVYWLCVECKFCKGKNCDKCNQTGKGDWISKYRGFDQGTLIREDIIKTWPKKIEDQSLTYEATLTRFIGLGSALSSTKYFQLWRTWQTQKRELHIWPTGKRASIKNYDYSRGTYPTKPLYNIAEEISYKYPLPWESELDTDEWDYTPVDGVPGRIVKDELEDSWNE